MSTRNFLIIGSDHCAALELIFQRELLSLGHNVKIFPAQSFFLEYYNRRIFNKISFRLGLSSIMKIIQQRLIEFILENNPTVVLVFKGMEITPETLIWMKKRGIKIYNYNPDHPFVFSGRGSGNENVTNSIMLFDEYFSYAQDAVDTLMEMGVKSEKIPFGFDERGFEYRELTKENEVLKTCFLGNADKDRAKCINQLALSGLEIDVYGENWSKYKLEKTITAGPAQYGVDFWLTLQKYAVQLNLLRPHNNTTHNMRSFDIPGAGGIMLAPFTKDHSSYFENNSEVYLFKDLNEALLKADRILNLAFAERQLIRAKAHQRSLNEHTYYHRVSQLIEAIEN